jgi:hypothetical protein
MLDLLADLVLDVDVEGEGQGVVLPLSLRFLVWPRFVSSCCGVGPLVMSVMAWSAGAWVVGGAGVAVGWGAGCCGFLWALAASRTAFDQASSFLVKTAALGLSRWAGFFSGQKGLEALCAPAQLRQIGSGCLEHLPWEWFSVHVGSKQTCLVVSCLPGHTSHHSPPLLSGQALEWVG